MVWSSMRGTPPQEGEVMNAQSATEVDPRFGSNAEPAMSGHAGGVTHAIGDVLLTAGRVAGGTVAKGQILQISQNQSLFNLLGNKYGGDGTTTFALPDLRDAAPNGLTYYICVEGSYPTPN
jgi:tail collar domain